MLYIVFFLGKIHYILIQEANFMLYKGRTDLATESFRQLDSSARDLTEKQGIIAAHEQLHGLELMAV